MKYFKVVISLLESSISSRVIFNSLFSIEFNSKFVSNFFTDCFYKPTSAFDSTNYNDNQKSTNEQKLIENYLFEVKQLNLTFLII